MIYPKSQQAKQTVLNVHEYIKNAEGESGAIVKTCRVAKIW